MTSGKRTARVADLIRAEIADICIKELRDPRIGTLTITGVKITDDLKVARVFFVKIGEDICDPKTTAALEAARGFIRRELGQRLKLRAVPELIFAHDESFAYGSRIERILAEIKNKDDEHAK